MATDCPSEMRVTYFASSRLGGGRYPPHRCPLDLRRSVFMSRPTVVRAGAAVIAVAAATSLAACGGGGGGGSQSASDTLTIGLNADAAPGGYDPQLYSAGQYQFFSSMYDALFVTDTKG